MAVLLLLPLNAYAAFSGAPKDDANCQGAWLMDVDEDPITDSSQNSNTGALKGDGNPDFATANPPDTFSTGYYVWAATDYIDCASDTSLDDMVDMSIVAWAYPETVADFNAIASKFSDGAYANGWMLYINPSTNNYLHFDYGFNTQAGAWRTISAFGKIAAGSWYHFAVTFNNSADDNVPTFYINGVAQATDEVQDAIGTRIDDSAGNFIIGSNDDDDYPFDGPLDEVGAFNDILDSTEVNDIMDNGLAGAVTGPKKGAVMVIT